jgi:cytoskeletal protein CcmA (bactofilin family)
LRLAAKSAQINGKIGRSLAAVCFGDFQLGNKGSIGNDAFITGNIINIDGSINGKVKIDADKVYITGVIEKDLEIKAKVIQILSPALIKGDLIYTSSEQATIDISSGVTIVGETKWNLPEEEDKKSSFTDIVQSIAELLAVFLFGIILFTFTGKYINETMNQLITRIGISTSTGFLSSFVVILSALVLVVSLILMLIGAALISDNNAVIGAIILAVSTLLIPITSFITITGSILLYSGKIVIALLIGYYVTRIFKPKSKIVSKSKLLIGLLILFLLFAIPYFGNVFRILTAVIGTGGIILGIRHCRFENGNSK